MEKRLTLLVGGLVAALTLVAAGCGGSENGDEAASPPLPSAAGVPFDRAFIDGMVPHHEGAIEMAREAKAAGLSEPDLVEIADAIIATQQTEIDQMRQWRADWFGSSEIDPNGAETLGLSMDEMGMRHDAADLADADDVDATFATMMIDHHNGAIAMAELARTNGQHAEVRKLADAIIKAQEREVAIMREHASAHH
jgi:uncharacterized protein (DUF305 family)